MSWVKACAAPAGTDTPRELFQHMVDLPGFTAAAPDGSRVVMSGQLALTVSRRYRASEGGAALEATLQASSAMAEEWRELQATLKGSAAGMRRARVGQFDAVVCRTADPEATRVTVKLGEAPFTLFSLHAVGLGAERSLALARRFPLAAMREAVASR